MVKSSAAFGLSGWLWLHAPCHCHHLLNSGARGDVVTNCPPCLTASASARRDSLTGAHIKGYFIACARRFVRDLVLSPSDDAHEWLDRSSLRNCVVHFIFVKFYHFFVRFLFKIWGLD
jgi:hypothetical protein